MATVGQKLDNQGLLLTPANSIPGVYGFERSRYLKASAALAGVISGARRMRVGVIGDSISAGYGATTGDGGFQNMQPNSWPTRLAALLTTAGIPATSGAFWGFQGLANALTHLGWDPRLSLGTNWTNTGSQSLGGACLFFPNGGGTSPTSFTPTASFDNLRVWYVLGSGNGSFSTNVDGGASLGTVNTTGSGSGALGHTDFTVTAGTHTINLVPQNGQLNIIGIETWLSTAPRIEVFNFGVNGARSADKVANSNAWAPLNAISGFSSPDPVDLWIICLDVNDSNNQLGVAQYQANMSTLVAACQAAGGNVIMMGGPPSNGFEAYRAPYVAAERAVAAQYGCAFIDTNALMTTLATPGVAAGLYYTDTIHQSAQGLARLARQLMPLLTQL